MKRKFISFPIADLQQTKKQMLNWCNRFNICCFLDNHNYHFSHHSIECLAGAGSIGHISCSAGAAFRELSAFSKQQNDWLFGHFSYDLKNETENLVSENDDHIGFPDLFFFVPRFVLQLTPTSLSIGSFQEDHDNVWQEIGFMSVNVPLHNISSHVRSRYTREEYIETVRKLQQHILRGDAYEVNFCQEFYMEQVDLDPLQLFSTLSRSSPSPFAAYYKLDQRILLCMSPERYLKREGSTVWSQPIKGTAKRNFFDEEKDKLEAAALARNQKERAENVMVVDLVRNDLSRVCVQGSVRVDELCTIYSFPQVHQMISTISGELPAGINWTEVVKATFPMGSMTGAPKKRVMQLIEDYERTKRGLFSGSVGYVTPDENFDFNVVIRSVLYNSKSRYLSFQAGSAITFSSDPEFEFEECLLKVAAIKKALAETNTFH